jgi:hypothetical protein
MSLRIRIDRLVIDRRLAADRRACAEAVRAALVRELGRRWPAGGRHAEAGPDAGASAASVRIADAALRVLR